MPKYINDAVDAAITKIAVAQQNLAAFSVICHRIRGNNYYNDGFSAETINSVHAKLYADLANAWNDLSYFAPISEHALDLLAQRTKTWFAAEETEVMSFLGQYGSYYTKDKDAFKAEVRAMFQGEK
jgi:hypothetical protein